LGINNPKQIIKVTYTKAVNAMNFNKEPRKKLILFFIAFKIENK
jgi:hypothetical protein